MVKGTVHRTKNRKPIIRHYRFIPYGELAEVLKGDGEVFLEGPIKRQTAWKAARKLSQMIGKKVKMTRALLRVKPDISLEGYAFYLEESESPAH